MYILLHTYTLNQLRYPSISCYTTPYPVPQHILLYNSVSCTPACPVIQLLIQYSSISCYTTPYPVLQHILLYNSLSGTPAHPVIQFRILYPSMSCYTIPYPVPQHVLLYNSLSGTPAHPVIQFRILYPSTSFYTIPYPVSQHILLYKNSSCAYFQATASNCLSVTSRDHTGWHNCMSSLLVGRCFSYRTPLMSMTRTILLMEVLEMSPSPPDPPTLR